MAARATTTKTAGPAETAPAQQPEEIVYDFDGWTEEAEAAAIAAIKPDIKYIVVENSFVGRFEDGAIVKAPLGISLNDVDALEAEYANEIDRFRALIRIVGGDANVDEFARQDISAVGIMSAKYFDVLGRIQGAKLPES